MKKIKLFILLIFFCLTSIFAINWEQEIERLLECNLVEPTSYSFAYSKYSKVFINKFNFSNEEISLIGSWPISKNIPNQEDPRSEINTVRFYPNRIVLIETYSSNDFVANVLAGMWKIENGIVYIKQLFTFTTVYYPSVMLLEYTTFPQKGFVPIGNAEFEKKAVIQKTPWNFRGLDFSPQYTYPVPRKDYLRNRVIKESLYPSEFQRLDTQEKLRMFYLNPVYDDIDYFFQLFRTKE